MILSETKIIRNNIRGDEMIIYSNGGEELKIIYRWFVVNY